MIAFFLLAALLLLTALAFVVPALLRSGAGADPGDHDGQNVEIAREHLAELKRRHESGEIAAEELAAEREELERTLLDDLDTGSGAASSASPDRGRWMGYITAALIPVLAGTLYLSLGRPDALSPDPRPAVADHPDDAQHPEKVEEMVSGLAARLAENPDDVDGWLMLARSYMELSRFDEAADALGRVRGLVGDHPEILVRQADALAMSRNGRLAGEPLQLVQRALQQNPSHPQALWMAGSAAEQQGDMSQALAYYQRLEPLVDGDTRLQIRRLIARAEERGGEAASTAGAAPEPPAAPAVSVQVQVDLAPLLRDRADPDDTVFIFARALNGPPMPLAVARRKVSDLPATVVLDDSSAMTPAGKLSDFEEVSIAARISKSGNAVARSGDLQGERSPVATASGATVEISIDQVVP